MRTLDDTKAEQILFFEAIYGEETTGLACVSTRKIEERKWIDRYFKWPDEIEKMLAYINEKRAGHDVYACTTLQSEKSRKKEYAKDAQCLWADLDTCHPSKCNPPPTIQLTTSPGRYHGFWPLSTPVPGALASNYSKRIAYDLSLEGADLNGWDLSQVLRVPGTYNYKYGGTFNIDTRYTTNGDDEIIKFDIAIFNDLPAYESNEIVPWEDLPDLLPYDDVYEQFASRLPDHTRERHLSGTEQDDWSAVLFREVADLFNLGATKAEVFAFTKQSKVNKFERDGRNEGALWADILRIQQKSQHERTIVTEDDARPNLSSPTAPARRSFVEQYVDWAKLVTDAPAQYHEGAAFMMLSAVLSGHVTIQLAFEKLRPNLWLLILGDTTISRKTTTMKMAMRILKEVDDELYLERQKAPLKGWRMRSSNEGQTILQFTIETRLSVFSKGRRGNHILLGTSNFYCRFTMEERYVALFVKRQSRSLILSFSSMEAGLKTVYLKISGKTIFRSGLVPRFLWIMGDQSVGNLRPLVYGRDDLAVQEGEIAALLAGIKRRYLAVRTQEILGQVAVQEVVYSANLTLEAQERHNALELALLTFGENHEKKNLVMPIMSRLSMSCIKMATLLAASRQEPEIDETMTVELEDVEHAIYYIDKWMPYTMEMINHLGTSSSERLLKRIIEYIKQNPGASKSTLGNRFKLTSVELRNTMETLVDRQLVRAVKQGNGHRYFTE